MRDPSNALAPETSETIDRIFGLYDVPLWLITATDGERRGGFIATSVTRASIVSKLPRMLVTVAQHHHTWGLIESTGRFALHLLRIDDLDAIWRFALASGHHQDKLAGLPPARTPAGSPLYGEALSWCDCLVEQRMPIGDRTVYLAEVSDGALLREGPVMTIDTLRRQAPIERLAMLDRLYAEDQSTDAAAILAWRQARRHGID